MNIREYIKENTLILDGGMGTLLQRAGLRPGERPEMWSITHPDVVTGIHRDYFNAGANVVSTNTFGANSLKFSEDELETVIRAAVDCAVAARDSVAGNPPRFVALDIGPTGRMLEPLGDLSFEDAVEVFAKTVRMGVGCGVDLIFIETMSDSYETKAALLAAKENCDLPVFVSNAYGADGRLMSGTEPSAMVALLEGMGADAIGMNCSLGPAALAPVAREYLRCASVPVLMKPNAGLPRVVDGETVYDVSSEDFARELAALVGEGVRIVGGCCGTTPEYIAATAGAVKDIAPVPLTAKSITVVSSFRKAVTFGDVPVLIGERINPTGKKRFKEALRAGDMDYILSEGLAQKEAGAHILDVNVGLPEIDEPALLTRAVTELQAVCDLPLQVDTSDPIAMERALRHYNGKAMINSVSGKQESMDAVFPLAKKYGGVVVALTLDENGIPDTAEGRVDIALRIIAEAERYGIGKHDLIFDPLALTVSADSGAAATTLRTVEILTRQYGCRTSLGVSNVSFGLPRREIVNSTFFSLAMDRGLSAAIMNPHSADMMKAYRAFVALSGMDPMCAEYISFATSLPVEDTAAVPVPVAAAGGVTGSTELQNAIVNGLRDRSASLTESLCSVKDALSVVTEEIIPALNEVGVGFEEKRVYLPGLLMSAEAAKAAFEVVKKFSTKENTSTAGAVVIATVKGDIHDIGKNIVKLLLENYGFFVTDLGRDVDPEDVVAAVERTDARLVGLSALMTTTVPAMEETVRLVHERFPDCLVMVGGAVLTEEYSRSIGADKYARDAMEGVRFAEEVYSKDKKN